MSSMMSQQVTEALHQGQQWIQSVLDQHVHQMNTETFKGTDESETVSVTLDARRRLKDLHIEDGLLRLGTETVAQRINEAICDALAAASAAHEAEQQRVASLPDLPESFAAMLGLSEMKTA